MKFELLVSTMFKNTDEVLKMLKQSNVSCNVLVVVQGYTEGYEQLVQHGQSIRIFFTKDRGLSKSRNVGLRNCFAKYAYIMDDDVVVDNNTIDQLVDKMEADDTDVATCKYICEGGEYPKKYSNTEFSHSVLSAAKVSSIEICINMDSLRSRNIEFDQKFGLGTSLPSGEEYIFVTDCLKSGLKVMYYPIVVGVHPEFTSGLDFYTDRDKILAKREMLKRVFRKKSIIFILAFWVKKLNVIYKAGYTIRFTRFFIFGK